MRVRTTLCLAEESSLIGLGQRSYDGSAFAAYEDVIVVTANYRTNGEFIKSSWI